ncbi:MAG: TPM domain-containing protein, partial [Isosphaeraceae bacterium]|nr:TPM domain-containing protein [Isosphaeraceae bacterium]
MFRTRLWLALPLLLAAAMAPARAAEIRDAAGLFSAEAIREAQAKLDQIGQQYKVPVVIETVESIGEQSIDQAAVREAQRSGTKGIFILIAKEETKIEVLVSRGFQAEFPREQRLAIRDAFVAEFKKRDFDAGLARGVEAIERAASTAQARAGAAQRPEQGRHQAAPPVVARRNPPANPKGGSSGLSILIVIGLVILAVLIGIRLLSGLFGAQRGGYYAGSARPGGPGYGGPAPGPGYGPGPGGPAYGPGEGGGRGGGIGS